MPYDSILETIGKTPHVRINKLFDPRVTVWAKQERVNPGGSIKDRIALGMIEDAEKAGTIGPGSVLIEPTSGNTGIGLALVAAVKGYRLILVMPESFSIERRRLMKAYGAELDLTPRELGMKGAIARANELQKETPKSWIPMQFENQSNVDAHKRTTAEEIFADFPDGLDYIITGVGTGGHITAVAEVLKKRWPQLKVYAVDGVIQVDPKDAAEYARRAAREEGILIGVSSGASLAAVAQKLPEFKDGARVLTFTYDTGERYLSVEGLFPA